LGFSRKRQSILVGLAKVCAVLAPHIQFYFYRIDRNVMGAKWSRALAFLLRKEELGLLEGLVLEVLEERQTSSMTRLPRFESWWRGISPAAELQVGNVMARAC
jgi:hypothetical protein